MPFAPMAAINAVMAVAGLAPDGTPEPMRVSESWFPIESAPLKEWVRVRGWTAGVMTPVRYHATAFQVTPGEWENGLGGSLSQGVMSYTTPDEWRLLPEQT